MDNHPKSDDPRQASVDQFARFLAICAKEDPALTRRVTPMAAPLAAPLAPDDFFGRIKDLPALLRRQVVKVRPLPDVSIAEETYLEELVSLAIKAARQAEDASQTALAASQRARRGRLAFGAVGAFGIALGIAGLSVGQRSVGPTLEALDVYARDGLRPDAVRHAPVVFAPHPNAGAPATEIAAIPAPAPASHTPASYTPVSHALPPDTDAMPAAQADQADTTLRPLPAVYVPPRPPVPVATLASAPPPIHRTYAEFNARPPRRTVARRSPLTQFVASFQRDLHNLLR